MEAEAAQDLLDMVRHRPRRQHEPLRDLGIAEAAGDQLRYFPLAGRQLRRHLGDGHTEVVGAEISGRPVPAAAWHHVWAMLEYLLLLVDLFRALVRSRSDLIAENLLLRQQLAALTRPTQQRPRLRARDKLFWIVAHMVWRDWRRHLVVVRPETVIKWHRQGW